MRKFIETLGNIWSIKELRSRILFTLGLLLIYRFGSFVVLPGIDPTKLQSGGGQGLLGLLNAFTGGAFGNAAIFALGIMPYISASIVVQLLGFAVPYFQRLQKREGEAGRRKLNQITRWLTVAITLVQGGGYLTYIISQSPEAVAMDNMGVFWFSNIIILATGTIFAMWLGEKITDKGIGNGISLLIMIGIIATLPSSLIAEFEFRLTGAGGSVTFVLELAILVVVVAATVMLVQGVRRIPIQFAKRMVGRGSSQLPSAGKRDFIPLKVNAAGVMPIIFAQALMFLPATIAQLINPEAVTGQGGGFLAALNDFTSGPYNLIYFFLVVIFTYVYTALIVDPRQYSEYLKGQNAFIPGIKPGKPTSDFIDSVTTRITLPGSIFLGFVSILPAFAAAFGANISFAMFFGGTSLLIMVGVVLDTLQQVEGHLLMRRYDGLTKAGKLRKKGGMMGIGADL